LFTKSDFYAIFRPQRHHLLLDDGRKIRRQAA